MNMQTRKALARVGAGAALAAPVLANAAVDVSAVVTEIATANAPVAAIGAAVLLVIVGIKIFKWVRRAF